MGNLGKKVAKKACKWVVGGSIVEAVDELQEAKTNSFLQNKNHRNN